METDQVCAGWEKLLFSEESYRAMSDAERRRVLAHNLYGRERGCW